LAHSAMGCGASKKAPVEEKADSTPAPEPADNKPAATLLSGEAGDASPEADKPDASPEGLEELRKLFDTLDKDNDGNVTGQEWGHKVTENKELLSKYFGGSTLKEIGSAFSRIDADGNKSLTWDEFVVAAGLKKDA